MGSSSVDPWRSLAAAPRSEPVGQTVVRTPNELKAEVGGGRLDPEAVAAVIEASGGERVRLRPSRPGSLSEREIEVLRLMVHGLTNKQIAARLYLSPKTVGHHVEHIYNKIGVTSRAAAALFAMETGLV